MKYVAWLFFLLLSIGCARRHGVRDPEPRETIVRATPTEESLTPLAPVPLVPVKWIEIGTKKQFWEMLYAHPRVVVLFGATSCVPCHAAKAWWKEQTAPEGWTFAYWEWEDENDPKDREGQGALTRAFALLDPKQQETPYPFGSVVEQAKKGAAIRDVVSFVSEGYDNVTDRLRSWLFVHPNGLKP